MRFYKKGCLIGFSIDEKSVLMSFLCFLSVLVICLVAFFVSRYDDRQYTPIVHEIRDALKVSPDVLSVFGNNPSVKYQKNSSKLHCSDTELEGKSVFNISGVNKEGSVEVDWVTTKKVEWIRYYSNIDNEKTDRKKWIDPYAEFKVTVTIKKVEFLQ